MKLNHDLVRKVMLYLEDNLPFDGQIISSQIEIKGYSTEEIQYTVNKLYEVNYLKCLTFPAYKFKAILEITWDGHCFLDNIRDDAVWEKIKQKASTIASASIPVLSQIASTYISTLLQNNMLNVK